MNSSYYLSRVISGAVLAGAFLAPGDALASMSCTWDSMINEIRCNYTPPPPPLPSPPGGGSGGDGGGDGGGGGGGGSTPPPSSNPGDSASNPIKLTGVLLGCGQQSVSDTVAVSANYRSIYGLSQPQHCSSDVERIGKHFEVKFFNEQTGVISHAVYQRADVHCMNQDIMSVSVGPNCSSPPPGTWIP